MSRRRPPSDPRSEFMRIVHASYTPAEVALLVHWAAELERLQRERLEAGWPPARL